jgi:hypothetical protein
MVEGYCLKCKKKTQMNDTREVVMKNGRKAMKGVCKCGTNMFKILPGTGASKSASKKKGGKSKSKSKKKSKSKSKKGGKSKSKKKSKSRTKSRRKSKKA